MAITRATELSNLVGAGLTIDSTSGVITATKFVGDGSSLSNLPAASISGINTSGTTELTNLTISGVATATGNIDANANLDVDGQTDLDHVAIAGVTTFTGQIDGNGGANIVGGLTVNQVNCSGIATFGGNVSIAGTLTYEDVTSVDSIGIATARTGLRVTAGGIVVTAGVSTFAADIDANGHVDIDGHTELDNVNVAGVTTAATVNITTLNSDSLVGSAITISDKKFSSNKTLQERTKISSTAFDNGTASSLLVNVDEGMVHYRSSNLNSASTVPNIMSTVGINTLMGLGDALTVTLISNVSSTSNFINAITIEGQAVTETWVNGSAPTEGGGSNYDVYSFNIIKKGTSGTYNSDFIVLANHILYSG